MLDGTCKILRLMTAFSFLTALTLSASLKLPRPPADVSQAQGLNNGSSSGL